MIPVLVAAQPAARRERHLHPDAQRGVRPRVRAARPARGQPRRPRGGHPGRGRCCTSSPRASASRCRPRRRHRRPMTDPHGRLGVGEAEKAVESTFGQLREGLELHPGQPGDRLVADLPRRSPRRSSACSASSGPTSPRRRSGSRPRTSRSSSCRSGFGIVTGILLLNAYGRYLPRRRVIEGGLIALGVLLAALAAAGPISRLPPASRCDRAGSTCRP